MANNGISDYFISDVDDEVTEEGYDIMATPVVVVLEAALNVLMIASNDIQTAALVSMDGFVMASALPEGIQEDRVGAMSAAIPGLGERAAAAEMAAILG